MAQNFCPRGRFFACSINEPKVPSLLWIASGVLNMNFSQADHCSDSVDRSPLYMLITLGRHTGKSDPSTLILFVIRSGIDARHLLPNSGSYQRNIDSELVSANKMQAHLLNNTSESQALQPRPTLVTNHGV